MSGLDSFWKVIDEQLQELRTAKTADDVIRILANERNPYGDPNGGGSDAFFAGGGGDETPFGALSEAGWSVLWMEAGYHWSMKAPDGTSITYVEGDIYRGDRRPRI